MLATMLVLLGRVVNWLQNKDEVAEADVILLLCIIHFLL